MMRKLILTALTAAIMVPAVSAGAQSYGEVRDSQRDVRQSERRLDRAQAYGDRHDVREARRDLREDRRELRGDWRDYRETHRDAFRGGRYIGPRGYAYRPVDVGYRFAPTYYGQRYWVDPIRYRLPRAGAAQRWIRYGNDVALVNVRTGRVLTVHRDFFW